MDNSYAGKVVLVTGADFLIDGGVNAAIRGGAL